MNIKLENRIIIANTSINKINNFMDCDVLAEARNQLVSAKDEAEAIDALNYVISAINYRIDERPEVKDLYILHLDIIKNMLKEIKLIRTDSLYQAIKETSLMEAIQNKDLTKVAEFEAKAQAGEIIRII